MTRSAALLVLLLNAYCGVAYGLNPSLDISQYGSRSWTIREGFLKGQVYAIAQTPDGYLWLGTEFGLTRFDGVQSVQWVPPQGKQLPSNVIYSLASEPDGTLWIGTTKGLVSWKDGKLSEYPELSGQVVYTLFRDREGTMWAGSGGAPFGILCELHSNGIKCHGRDGEFAGAS
jgi:ligand-binding sensor domain-containing protein